jgi:carbon storage regulator
MLVLSRRQEEALVIRGDIIVRVLEVKGSTVRLGIDAPSDVRIQRREIVVHCEGEPSHAV